MAKILVVDDDDAIVDLLRMRLKDLGHTVVVAMDANAGMMAATREKPDLITLDFQMPAGDGARMYSLLRRNTFTFKTKIIFISGMSALDLEKTAPNDTGVRYLQKPIDMNVLKRLIGELLEAPAPDATPSAKPPEASAAVPPAETAGPEVKPAQTEGGAFGGDVFDTHPPH